MTETSCAFGLLEDRAKAEANPIPADRISVRDHIADVEIGAFQSERDTTQRLSFSIVVEVAKNDGAGTDDVDDILSYDTITEAISTELEAERFDLLETLAERIAVRLFTHPQPLRVFIRIEKLDRGPGKLGVEIVRARKSAPSELSAPNVLRPLVVLLDEPAIVSDNLSALIDRLIADARPILLCVDGSREGEPKPSDVAKQQRIDMLAIEQNGWRLSMRDQSLFWTRWIALQNQIRLHWRSGLRP